MRGYSYLWMGIFHQELYLFMIVIVKFKFYRLKWISKKQKWLDVAIYAPPSQCKSYFVTELTKVLDKCRSNFEKIVVLGDFNMESTNQVMSTVTTDNYFKNIIKSNTCFKTSNPHLLIFSFLKTSFTKMPPNKLRLSKHKSFDKTGFLNDVSNLPEKTSCTEWENQFLRVLNN